jgi:hypothetical protein
MMQRPPNRTANMSLAHLDQLSQQGLELPQIRHTKGILEQLNNCIIPGLVLVEHSLVIGNCDTCLSSRRNLRS